MKATLNQERLEIAHLKVSSFASRETLCFTATLLFDGAAIADVHNDGRGGATHLRAHAGKSAALRCAEQYAESLPPHPIASEQLGNGVEPLLLNITLDYLVDQLAGAMHVERKLRAAFNRDVSNKVMYIQGRKLLYLKGVKLKAIVDHNSYFATLRANQGQRIVILAELPIDEAYALWKLHVLGGSPIDNPLSCNSSAQDGYCEAI